MSNSVDKIIIVGAGIVGTVQALLLARAGLNVTLVDAGVATGSTGLNTDLNARTVALSYRSRELLDAQQLWPADTGCPINKVHATERGRFGAVRLSATDFDLPALGYVVQNSVLESYLIESVKNTSNVELIQSASAELLSNGSDSVTVKIKNESGTDTREAALLIAADGTHSTLRASLGIEARTFDYEQHAIVANLRCQRDHQNVAFERFTETGPLALLPLAHKQMAMVYTANSADNIELNNQTDKEFLSMVQRRFGGRLGRFEAIGKRVSFPLSLVQSATQTSGCAVLIGNSARTVHPVAGQGLNLALRDVVELAAQVAGIKSNPGSVPEILAEFTRKRMSDQQAVVRQTDLLARFYRQHSWPLATPLSLFRTTSMLLLDAVPVLRKGFGAMNAGLNIPLSNFVPNQTSRHDRY